MRLLAAAILAGMVAAAAPHAARADEAASPGRYGVMGDIGLPDGMVASFAYRARPRIGVHLGLGHNTNRASACAPGWRRRRSGRGW